MRTWGEKEHEWRGKSCGEILRRSGGQVCKPPPTQPGPWSAGQLVSRCHWSGGGAAGRVSGRAKTCCKCLNCCHNKQLGQQLPPFLVVNATTAHAALVQHDERRREPGPLPVLWPSVPVVVAVLRWSAAGPLAVPGLAWSAVAVVADPMQSAGTDRRG
jgi:hypothetical protein